MSIDPNRSCGCRGMNSNCFRCDASGLFQRHKKFHLQSFFKRVLVKAGDRSLEELQQKQLDEPKREKAKAIKEAQLLEESRSIRRIA